MKEKMLDQQRDIRMLRISFDTPIKAEDIKAFRGAVAAKVGLDQEWFHNHNNRADATSNYHYRYPLVQYKRVNRRPAILFVDGGVEQAQHFFAQPRWSISFGPKHTTAEVTDMQIFKHVLGIGTESKRYRLRHWLAFNQKNFEVYRSQRRLVDQLLLLEKALVGHILAFANGVDFRFERRFSLGITQLLDQKTVLLSRNKMIAFDIEFESDAMLPPMIGLGRGVSRGMGEVTSIPNSPEKSKI